MQAGNEVLAAGVTACVRLSDLALSQLALPDGGTGKGGLFCAAELSASLPACLRSVRQGVAALYATGAGTLDAAGTAAAASAVPVLFRALEEAPGMAPEVLGATALLAVAESAAVLMPQQRGGSGLTLLATSLRDSLEHGDGPTTRDGLLTAAGVAKGGVAAAARVISAGIASTAEVFLQVRRTRGGAALLKHAHYCALTYSAGRRL